MVLEYKGHTFRHGDYIEGTIKGEPVSGHLNTEDEGALGHYFFCQDEKQGNECPDMLGHKYSWVFTLDSNGNCRDGVELIIPENSSKVKFTEDTFSRVFVDKSLSKESFKYNYHNRLRFSFSFRPLSNVGSYVVESIALYNKLSSLKEDVKDKVIKDLKHALSRIDFSNLTIFVENNAGNSDGIVRFLEDELDFYRCNVYRNRYSGSIVNCLTKNL